MPPSLRVTDLHKHYVSSSRGEAFRAVNGVSFTVDSGSCFGLLGPNGAGKSTTIQCITGFFPPSAGKIELLGIDVHQRPKEARQFLGVCSQEDTLDTDFNVLDQLVRHATFFGIAVPEGKERAQALLKRFGLWEKASEPVEALSGGMRRRLQVARSLISEPKVLVLDEPTTGLDPEARRVLWEIISDYRARGLAILLSTHYMEEAERLCDLIAIIHRGKILDLAPPQDLILKHIKTQEIEEDIRPGVKWKRPANLEDVYLKLTGTSLSGESL